MTTPIDGQVITGYLVTDGTQEHQVLFDELPTHAEVCKLTFRWRESGRPTVHVCYFQAKVRFAESVKTKR